MAVQEQKRRLAENLLVDAATGVARVTRHGQAQQGLALQRVNDAEGHVWARERQLQHALAAGLQLVARPASAVPVGQATSGLVIASTKGSLGQDASSLASLHTARCVSQLARTRPPAEPAC